MVEGLFTIESAFQVAVAVDEWDLAADAAARLVDHDKAYAGATAAAETIAARQR